MERHLRESLRRKSERDAGMRELDVDYSDGRERSEYATVVITPAEILQKYEDYAPGMGHFEKNPRPYTDRWKKRWARKGQASQQRNAPITQLWEFAVSRTRRSGASAPPGLFWSMPLANP